MDLSLIFAAILAFGVIMYVILDGFDLGVGILFCWIKNTTDRSIMMDTIAPVWDGNETWLVLGGALLYGAFPYAYSILLPALYIPIMFMLAALIFRGIAFEFCPKATRSKTFWENAFCAGSTLAAFIQGVILGAFIEGKCFAPEFSHDYFSWLTPFSFMTGLGVVNGYGLLGVTWLIAKTHGLLQEKKFQAAKWLLIGIGLFLILVSIFSPLVVPHIAALWFSLPNFYYLISLPIMTALSFIWLWISLTRKKEFLPFRLSICLFVFAYVGLAVSVWPYLVPHQLTIWQAAASPSSQKFILLGTVILLPILLTYTIYTYKVFAGKIIQGGQHYET